MDYIVQNHITEYCNLENISGCNLSNLKDILTYSGQSENSLHDMQFLSK